MKTVLPPDYKLPAMPKVARECLLSLYSADVDTNILVKALSKDIGISASILKLANSSNFVLGRGSLTSDLKSAMLRIGHDNIRQILLLYSLENTFSFDEVLFLDFKTFCRHCSFVSLLCSKFGKKIIPDLSSDLQMAGLMHDVGIAILGSVSPDTLKKIAEYCDQNKCSFLETEQKLFEDSHGELGAECLSSWQIPNNVKLIISLHDTKKPEERGKISEDMHKCVDIIGLADTLAHSYGYGYKGYKRDTRVEISLLKKLGLTPDDVKSIVKDALEVAIVLHGA